MHQPEKSERRESTSNYDKTTTTTTDRTHSTDSKSDSDQSEGKPNQLAKTRKKIDSNFSCTDWRAFFFPLLMSQKKGGDLEKETWKAAAALRAHVGSLWRNHLSTRAVKMRAAHCGIPEREGTPFESYYSGSFAFLTWQKKKKTAVHWCLLSIR